MHASFKITDTRDNREHNFVGERLAQSTTKAAGRQRWSEMELYRTAAGSYILVKTGRTTYDDEFDRVSVTVSHHPDGIIESAHARDGDGVMYLSHMARRLLEAASKLDDHIRDAFYTTVIP